MALLQSGATQTMPKSFLGHLQQRNAGFYFRRRIPDPLRPIFGLREFYWSLETPVRSLAQTRGLESWSFSSQLLESVRAEPHTYPQDELDLAISAFKVLARSRWSRQARRSSSGGKEPKRLIQLLEGDMLLTTLDPQYKSDLRSFLERSFLTSTHAFENDLHADPTSVMGAATLGKLENLLRAYLEDPDHHQLPFDTEGGLQELLEACQSASPGIGASDPGAARRYFNREFTKAFLRIVEANRRVLTDPGYSLPLPQASWSPQQAELRAARPASPCISAAWAEYKLEKSWKPASEVQFDALINELIGMGFIGDKPVAELTRDDLIRFRNTLKRLPAHRNKLKAYRDKSIAELLAMDIPEDKRIGEVTINDKLTTLASFLSWCHKIQGYLDRDITSKIQYQKAVKQKRGIYSPRHLAQMFDPDHYRPSLISLPFQFWIPLLGLHSGARISEIAQLSPNDLVERDGIYLLRILDSDEGQSVKTENGKRLVPVHESLIQLGFLEFVDHQRRAGEDRIFSDLRFGKHKPGAKASLWFTDFRRARGIPDRNELGEPLVFHSFRHTVTTNLRTVQGHEVTKVQQILGHKKSLHGATDIYTHAYDDGACKAAVNSLRFQLDLARLKETWEGIFASHKRKAH